MKNKIKISDNAARFILMTKLWKEISEKEKEEKKQKKKVLEISK